MPGHEKQRGEREREAEEKERERREGRLGIVAAGVLSLGRIKFVTAHSFARFQFGLICLNGRWPKAAQAKTRTTTATQTRTNKTKIKKAASI